MLEAKAGCFCFLVCSGPPCCLLPPCLFALWVCGSVGMAGRCPEAEGSGWAGMRGDGAALWGCSCPVNCRLTLAGFVVGHAGLYQALAMFAVAYFIIGMTVLSVCAIATNGALDAGGAYCILFWVQEILGGSSVAPGCHSGAVGVMGHPCLLGIGLGC